MKIIISRSATAELEAIFRYLVRLNPRAAHAIRHRIVNRISQLAVHPYLGPISTQIADTRELVEGPYVICYELRADCVAVLHVFHGAQERSQK